MKKEDKVLEYLEGAISYKADMIKPPKNGIVFLAYTANAKKEDYMFVRWDIKCNSFINVEAKAELPELIKSWVAIN